MDDIDNENADQDEPNQKEEPLPCHAQPVAEPKAVAEAAQCSSDEKEVEEDPANGGLEDRRGEVENPPVDVNKAPPSSAGAAGVSNTGGFTELAPDCMLIFGSRQLQKPREERRTESGEVAAIVADRGYGFIRCSDVFLCIFFKNSYTVF